MERHIAHLISDYLLGLLPASERQKVESHAATCPQCRQQLTSERELITTLRLTLAAIPMPSSTRLAQLQPLPPKWTFHQQKLSFFSILTWQKSFATALVALFLVWGWLHLQPTLWWESPTPYIAATATQIPTATATQTLPNYQLTPTIVATPIAALPEN